MVYTLLILLAAAVYAALPAGAQTLAPGQDPDRRKQFVDVHFEDRERTTLTVEATAYEFTVDLTRPQVTRLVNRAGSRTGDDVLGGASLSGRARADGVPGDSLHAPKPARLNIWRHGLYYYEIHVLDFELGAVEGDKPLPLRGELVFYCYPEKFHMQALLRPTGTTEVAAPAIAWKRADPSVTLPGGAKTAANGQVSYAVTSLSVGGAVTQFVTPISGLIGKTEPGILAGMSRGVSGEFSGWFAVLPSSADPKTQEALLQSEIRPLPPSAFRIQSGGVFTGYDAVRGVYVLHTAQAPAPTGFEANWVNPNEYPTVRFTVQNDDLPRRIYVEQVSDTGGSVEAAVVCDENGWPLPIPVQTCKNFAGENEEPDDTPFSESYFPLLLQPREKRTLSALHLFQNWGNHPLKQISSIRFFEHYWHMSTGVTETTCHVPFTKRAYPDQGYNVPDFRGMSGITWLGQPQHHHVALHGFLQYNDGAWHYLRYLGSKLDYVAPCFAQFTTRFVTDDNKVRVTVTIFEAPSTDETRTFTRVRYDVDDTVQIAGDARKNLKLFTGNTDITRNRYRTAAWTGEDGTVRTRDFEYDGSWPLLGEPLGKDRPIYCLYASDRSNDAFVVLKYAGKLGGKPLERLGASLATYTNRVADHILTTTEPSLRLERGDWLEADVILMPYGDQHSDWSAPERERTYFGSDAPKVAVRQGAKVLDFPTTVKASDSVAEFTLTGGHNALPLIVQGMEHYDVPLLWENAGGVWQWVNPQVRGGDGYQVQDGPDGGYETVFTVKQRNGMSHHYLVTQARAEAGLVSVAQQNHNMVVTAKRRSAMRIVGPRLFLGFEHALKPDDPAIVATGEAQAAVSAPMSAAMEGGTARLLLQRYSATGVTFRADGHGTLRIRLAGLKAGTAYRLRAGDEARALRTDANGGMEVTLRLTGPVEVQIAQ